MTVNCDMKLYAGHEGKNPRIAYPYTKWRQVLNLNCKQIIPGKETDTNRTGDSVGHRWL